jgi:indole-3-glycerol phosphate synthase
VLRTAAESAGPCPSWAAAFGGDTVSVVAEVKRRSPSVEAIAEGLDPASLSRAYELGGASAVSVLTNERFFGGSNEDLERVRAAVALPVLRKDFVLDATQVYEARAIGASAVLLIVRALEPASLMDLAQLSAELGMGVLVEVHDASEVEVALESGGVTIGVNSRDLSTFEVQVESLEAILTEIPPGWVAIAESGLSGRADVERVAGWGADAVLVGTAVAGSASPAEEVRRMSGVRRHGRG